ncbi:hypothetical protein KBB12_04125 [Candidatus Woesebacteria bacterium]|nr:hypothetical protein [Candidatus Woesebacteria bacterium]
MSTGIEATHYFEQLRLMQESGSIPDAGYDDPLSWRNLAKIQKLGLALAVCDGNAMRSRLVKLALNSYGIPAIAAAVGDVSKQVNRVHPPDSVMRFVARVYPTNHELGWQPGLIKRVTPLMYASARYVLVACDRSHLLPWMNPNDERLNFVTAADPQDETEYYGTYCTLMENVSRFVAREYPRHVWVTTSSYPTRKMSDQLFQERSQLDFSCIPFGWDHPLKQYAARGQVF